MPNKTEIIIVIIIKMAEKSQQNKSVCQSAFSRPLSPTPPSPLSVISNNNKPREKKLPQTLEKKKKKSAGKIW